MNDFEHPCEEKCECGAPCRLAENHDTRFPHNCEDHPV